MSRSVASDRRGLGATFTVELPAIESMPAAGATWTNIPLPAPATDRDLPRLNDVRVLVIDVRVLVIDDHEAVDEYLKKPIDPPGSSGPRCFVCCQSVHEPDRSGSKGLDFPDAAAQHDWTWPKAGPTSLLPAANRLALVAGDSPHDPQA